MQKKKISGKTAVRGLAAGGLVLVLAGVSLFGRPGQEQKCRSVVIDGERIGYVPEEVDAEALIRAARRELAGETAERLCMDYEWNTDTAEMPSSEILQPEEMTAQLKKVLSEKVLRTKERAYTVAVGTYRGNFASLEEVEAFLNRVKSGTDEQNEFVTSIEMPDGQHIDGILTAELTEKNGAFANDVPGTVLEKRTTEKKTTALQEEAEDTSVQNTTECARSVEQTSVQTEPDFNTPETGAFSCTADILTQVGGNTEEKAAKTVSHTAQETDAAYETEAVLSSGALAETARIMELAAASVQQEQQEAEQAVSGGYATGILDLEFVENIEVYENYVDADELSDIDEAVAEVTKEKESNKIYQIENGDCLSVIAMDNDTSVSEIMAMNGLANANAIREGQELVIAVPQPDLKLRVTRGEVYEEDYQEDEIIIENDSWYTTKQEVVQEGTVGHRERNDLVVYENGVEVERELLSQKITLESQASIIERGTVIPPTYIKPLAGGRFTSGFGRRWGRLHKGVDWACPVGTPVYASSAGTVIQASYNGGYGNNVVISHADGRMTRYAHNSKLLVQVGQHVEQGEAIALSGNTGRSTGPHVHFEIYINGEAVNPLQYIGN